MRSESMWRYRSRLGVGDTVRVVSLGEGMTPLIWSERLGLYIKDEGCNPGGTCRARAASLQMTLTAADEVTVRWGVEALYAAAAGKQARLMLPFDAPQAEYLPGKAAGAVVTFGDAAAAGAGSEAYKTIAFEIVEQLGGEQPGTVVSTLDEGVLRRGFEEMGGSPDLLSAAAVPKRAALLAALELAAAGVYGSPEAGACLIALRRQQNLRGPVVLINPESGLLHAEAWSTQFARNIECDRDRLGGLITPR